MNQPKKKINSLRAVMKEQGVDAYIIPNTDPHLSEYIPDHWKIVQWLTGFSGSAAIVLVTRTFAGLWTDSRYFIQAAEQLKGSGFELVKVMRSAEAELIQWMKDNFKKGGIIGFDGRLISIETFRRMKNELESKLPVFVTDTDLVSDLWENRPALPEQVAFEHSVDFAGAGRSDKIARVREEMTKSGIDYQLLTSPDDIMWLLNIRAGDVHYSPLLLSFSIISDTQVLLFTDESKINPRLAREFDKENIVLLPYDEVSSVISTIPEFSTLQLSPANTSVSLYNSPGQGIKIIEQLPVPTKMKAVKNEVEQKNIRQAMIKDGVALTRFFMWLEENTGKTQITESSAAAKLREFRLQQTNCTGESFHPIVAFGEHAALPHYSFAGAPPTSIGKNGILLVDSGGQYLDGTTDVTRTVTTGKAGKDEKRDFTLALKGMIKLSMARFPVGTRGYQLDILARSALWDNGFNYGHGTGHGVGFFLNVHEGPQSVSPVAGKNSNIALVPGMVISVEPGIYREGRYGFRTENLVCVKEDMLTEFGQFLSFETLTLCFIDTGLIDKALLDNSELNWLNSYHAKVYKTLRPFLDNRELGFLALKTKEI